MSRIPSTLLSREYSWRPALDAMAHRLSRSGHYAWRPNHQIAGDPIIVRRSRPHI